MIYIYTYNGIDIYIYTLIFIYIHASKTAGDRRFGDVSRDDLLLRAAKAGRSDVGSATQGLGDLTPSHAKFINWSSLMERSNMIWAPQC